MSLLSSLKNLISPPAALLCPRCEKPLDGHDRAACERRMSRRYLFGAALGGVAAAVAVAQAAPVLESGIAIAHVNQFLNADMVTGEMLMVLRSKMRIVHNFNGESLNRLDVLYGASLVRPEYGGRIIWDGDD